MDSTPTALIPDPTDSWEQFQRFTHQDLSALSDVELWAERTVLASALARAVFERGRDRLIVGTSDTPVTRQDWLRDRLARLSSEAQRRRRRAA